MSDPFQVLGISSGATDEEIKKAYRAKCKMYHPDLNPGDPVAEEKFKEVQTAYTQIMDIKQGRASYNPYGGSQQRTNNQYQSYTDPFGFGGFGFGFDPFSGQSGYRNGYGGQQQSTEMQAALNFIRNARYVEALNVLNSVPDIQRQGRWYYYYALANQGMGNRVNALENIRKALQFEPDNLEYRALYQQLQNSVNGYQTQYSQYGSPLTFNFGGGNFCLQLILWNLLCNCFCGGCGRGGFYI